MRKCLVVFMLFGLFSALTFNAYSDTAESKPEPPVEPLSLSLKVDGRFSKGEPWQLKATPNGEAHLSIESYPKPKLRNFKVSATQFDALRKALIVERFFELENKYGDLVPDGSTRTLTITQAKKSKTISLHFLREGDAKVPEIRRALRVWHLIRGWFNDAEAVDLRPYDRRILDETPPDQP